MVDFKCVHLSEKNPGGEEDEGDGRKTNKLYLYDFMLRYTFKIFFIIDKYVMYRFCKFSNWVWVN